MKICVKKYYTTGEAAKICGFKSSRTVAKMFDEDEILGELVHSKLGRHTTRRISLGNLVQFMRKRKIPLNRLYAADNETLVRQISEVKKMVEKSGRIGVFSGFNGLAERLLDMIRNLDPITNLNGVSEDRRRVANLRKIADAMELHIKVRQQIAKVAKAGRK